MKLSRTFSLVIAACVLFVGMGMSPNSIPSGPRSDSMGGTPPNRFINPDGTLRMDGKFSGILDLSGWNVLMDSQRGPIFVPADASTAGWNPLGNGLNDYVYAIAISGNDVYVGGYFFDAGGNASADGIAMWNGSTWSALGSGISTGAVYTIAISGNDVYAGGYFQDAGGVVNANYIAKWDGSNWSALGSNAFSQSVLAIAVDGTTVYAGGNFLDAASDPNADYIAQWNGSAWSALGSGLNSSVGTIVLNGSDILVGGSFTDAGGDTNADYLAKWNGSSWSAVAGGLNGSVSVIAVNGGELIIGGSFTNAGGNADADYIAKWNGSAWSPFGNGLNWEVYGISLNGGNVYAVGLFTDAGGDPNADRVAMWNGTNWVSLGGIGMSNNVNAIAISASAQGDVDIYVGGCFQNTAGNPNADYIAYYQPIANQSYKSQGTSDGWILESAENSNTGGTMNAAAGTLSLGDNAQKKQYRSILSFNTSSLPDNAIITKVTLKLKRQGVAGGGNPIATFQGFMVDIKKGAFGTAPLALADFKATASKTVGPQSPALTSGWYSLNLTPAKDYVNKLATNSGLTQMRLRFKLDDNNNAVANILNIFSGNNATAANRPTLVVEYYVP